MAIFNPDIKPEGIPNYTGASKEPSRLQADTSLGGAVKDIGDIFSEAPPAFNRSIKENIQEDTQAQMDDIFAAHGVGVSPEDMKAIVGKGSLGRKYTGVNDDGTPADNLGAEGEFQLPSGVSMKVAAAEKLKALYDAGELSQGHFDATVEAAKKQLRNRYPGYREEIDQEFEKITGTKSANAVRRDIL